MECVENLAMPTFYKTHQLHTQWAYVCNRLIPRDKANVVGQCITIINRSGVGCCCDNY